jgi:hypothetical protein
VKVYDPDVKVGQLHRADADLVGRHNRKFSYA